MRYIGTTSTNSDNYDYLAEGLRKEPLDCIGVAEATNLFRQRAFYARFGFADLPGDPRRAMIVRITDLEASGFEIQP